MNDTDQQRWRTILLLLTRIADALEKLAEEAHALRVLEETQHGGHP
jgi:hypothetical protein